MRSICRLTCAAVFVTLIATAWNAAPASAHSELIESKPASGSTVKLAPATVELIFGEDVQEQGGSIAVSGVSGRIDSPGTFTTNQNVASVDLAPDAPAGRYQVAYRVVSADGHVVSDTFTYRVAGSMQPSGTASPSPTSAGSTAGSAVDSTPLAGDPATDDENDSNGTVVWVLGAGAIGLVLIAALIAVAVRGRRGGSS